MTHGDPLSFIKYDIGILPLIHELRTAHLQVKQPWYADNTGVEEKLDALQEHIRDILVRGPPQGNYPELTKSIFVVSPWILQREEAYFWAMDM